MKVDMMEPTKAVLKAASLVVAMVERSASSRAYLMAGSKAASMVDVTDA